MKTIKVERDVTSYAIRYTNNFTYTLVLKYGFFVVKTYKYFTMKDCIKKLNKLGLENVKI